MNSTFPSQPELYKKDLTRQESTESSSTAEMECAGKLHFALRYDKEIEGLVVKVSFENVHLDSFDIARYFSSKYFIKVCFTLDETFPAFR